MGETSRLIKNTGIIAMGGMATRLVQFLLLPLYTSVLSTADYGIVDYINTIALFCVPAVSLLMDEALFRFLIDCESDEDRTRIASSSCAVLLLGCIAFSAAMFVVWLVARPSNVAWVIGLIVSSCLLQMTSAVMRGFGDTVSYTVLNFIASLTSITLNVLFIAVFRWGAVGMLSATVLSQGCIAIVFLVKKRIWDYIHFSEVRRQDIKALLSYSIPLIPNRVSWTIMNMLDRLIIMNTLGASQAGVYAVSYKFPSVMDQVYGFFYQSWKESAARVLNSGEDESDFYNKVYRSLRRFMMSVVLGMSALMPIVYGILIKGSFGEGMFYVPILLLATYYSNMSGYYGGIFTAHKDTGIMGTTTVVSALLCVALCFVLIPTMGLYGASVATLASTFAVNEYRRAKTAQYAVLKEDVREKLATAVSIVAVFTTYYIAAYTESALASIACLAISLVYFFAMNSDLIRTTMLSLRKKGK